MRKNSIGDYVNEMHFLLRPPHKPKPPHVARSQTKAGGVPTPVYVYVGAHIYLFFWVFFKIRV